MGRLFFVLSFLVMSGCASTPPAVTEPEGKAFSINTFNPVTNEVINDGDS